MQLLGVGSGTNVVEGYPNFARTPSQDAIVARFPEFMTSALAEPYAALEARAHAAFFQALGQASAPVGSGRITSFYASTIALDVVANCVARIGRRVAVIHPTLDCIPALLRGRGLELVPLGERALASRAPLDALPAVDAVFIASPNNPTGTVLRASELARIADACRERDAVLVIDQCFRAFDSRAQFDTYAILDASGVDYVVAEDTGKLWPMGGLKLGFLVARSDTRLAVAEASSDILLTAPPFTTAVVEALALDMGSGGLERLQAHIGANRALLIDELAGCARAAIADGDSKASVSRIRLAPDLTGTRVWGKLLRVGVHAVPCRPFYWARPRQGERFVRFALARDPDVVRRAARALRAIVDEA